MKAIILFGMCAIVCITANSQSQGPLNGSVFTTVAIPGSSSTWSNTSNSVVSDNSYSSFGDLSGGAGSYTDYLVVSNFNFAIPDAAVISGIMIEVEDSDPNQLTSEYRVRILNGGIIGSYEKATGAAYPATDAYRTYGGNGDLWNDSWTPKDINNASFGIAIAAQRNAAGGVTAGEIDDIRITVYYQLLTLPVKLLSFSAIKGPGVVHLEWKTAEESNMDHYEVERSADGRNFTNTG